MVWQMVADGVADAFHLSPKQRKSRNGPQDHADRRATPERPHADRRATPELPRCHVASRRLTLTGDRRGELPRCHVDHRARLTSHSDLGLTWLNAQRGELPRRHSASTSQRLDEGILTGHSVAHRARLTRLSVTAPRRGEPHRAQRRSSSTGAPLIEPGPVGLTRTHARGEGR